MATHQLQGTGGSRDRSPRRLRDPRSSQWLANRVTDKTAPQWTKDRAKALLFLPAAAERSLYVLARCWSIEAEEDK